MTFSSEYPSTFLSLERYANILGLDPIRFFQGETSVKTGYQCEDVWYQLAFQDDQRISREELRQAISQAESDLIDVVKFFPAPQWYTETVDYPQFYQKEYRGRWGFQSNGFLQKTVHTRYGKLIGGGIRATTQIDSSSISRGSDIDTTGDGFDDTAVFTITGIDFAICELQAYFKAYDAGDAANCRTDPGSEGADEYWRIRPINATLSSTTATVYIPVWLLFKPQLQRQISATEPINADNATSYVDTIEFWRVYNDTSTQASLLWATESWCSDYSCAWATQEACLRKASDRRGLFTVTPGTYDSTTGYFSQTEFTQNSEPDKVILYYYSGEQNNNKRNCDELSYWWAMNIAVLATARLRKPICSCENILRSAEKWQEEITLSNTTRSFAFNIEDLSNPLGTTYGALWVWHRIKNRGIRLGKRINVY